MIETNEQFYNANIKGKVDEIRKLCNSMKIPCFMTFGVRKEEGSYVLRGACLLPELFGEPNTDRRFADFVCVQNGFTTVPPTQTGAIEFGVDDFSLPMGFGQAGL